MRNPFDSELKIHYGRGNNHWASLCIVKNRKVLSPQKQRRWIQILTDNFMINIIIGLCSSSTLDTVHLGYLLDIRSLSWPALFNLKLVVFEKQQQYLLIVVFGFGLLNFNSATAISDLPLPGIMQMQLI